MEDKHYEKILEGIKKIEITQAVTQEKLSNIKVQLEKANDRLDNANTTYELLEKRVDVHDKIVGAIALSVVILGTLIKYKII